ncbi:serine protease inhibitor Kazal-type 10-like [Microcebus murinus]|uniref:serine protease inhibitor Kazal-type 10-like n=1 Tax=Microcebus murinus TaxID=30608 RepID=UPI003F6C5280
MRSICEALLMTYCTASRRTQNASFCVLTAPKHLSCPHLAPHSHRSISWRQLERDGWLKRKEGEQDQDRHSLQTRAVGLATHSVSVIKAIFILFLAFPILSESFVSYITKKINTPKCYLFTSSGLRSCTDESQPVCASNGQNYLNECVFCNKKKFIDKTLKFDHYGVC